MSSRVVGACSAGFVGVPEVPVDVPLLEELFTSPWLHAASHSFWSMVVSPSGLAALKFVTYGALCASVRPGALFGLACCHRLVHSLWLNRVEDSGYFAAVTANATFEKSAAEAAAARVMHFMVITSKNFISLHRKSPNSCGSTLIFRCGRVRNSATNKLPIDVRGSELPQNLNGGA